MPSVGAGGARERDDLVAALFERDYAGLCRLAGFLLSDPQRAEDVVQEAFVRTFSRWGHLRDPDRAGAYLRRAVVNLCRSRLRRRRTEQAGNEAAWRHTEDLAPDLDPSAVVIVEAVRRLPARQREVVVLRYFADLSVGEVARTMGCTEGTVKSQMSKARARLAEAVGTDDGDGDR